ncbi:MAG: hypothetical protein E3J37_01145 [Anaerolineales bacterium]|nr:MAG: hypothetical protein E3J37_01145 [Anaerolineales bacterium]
MMFDSLRDISDDSTELEQPLDNIFEPEPYDTGAGRFLGMTTGQRLVISLLLLATVIVLGFTCLMVTEKIWLF